MEKRYHRGRGGATENAEISEDEEAHVKPPVHERFKSRNLENELCGTHARKRVGTVEWRWV
jgi:hypothetical protein